MSDVTFFGYTPIKEHADLEALWAAILAATCGVDGSPLVVRHLAFPFGDGASLANQGEYRALQLRSDYRILGWYLRALDVDGIPTPVTCEFALTRLKYDDTTADPIGAGTPPALVAQSKAFGDPTDWDVDDLLGDAKDTIIAQLVALTAGSTATTVLLTLIVQDRVAE
jgi:hypothetical protein